MGIRIVKNCHFRCPSRSATVATRAEYRPASIALQVKHRGPPSLPQRSFTARGAGQVQRATQSAPAVVLHCERSYPCGACAAALNPFLHHRVIEFMSCHTVEYWGFPPFRCLIGPLHVPKGWQLAAASCGLRTDPLEGLRLHRSTSRLIPRRDDSDRKACHTSRRLTKIKGHAKCLAQCAHQGRTALIMNHSQPSERCLLPFVKKPGADQKALRPVTTSACFCIPKSFRTD